MNKFCHTVSEELRSQSVTDTLPYTKNVPVNLMTLLTVITLPSTCNNFAICLPVTNQ